MTKYGGGDAAVSAHGNAFPLCRHAAEQDVPEPTRRVLCVWCGSQGPHIVGIGQGPHWRRLVCTRCGKFLK
jgi:hypothetical protein